MYLLLAGTLIVSLLAAWRGAMRSRRGPVDWANAARWALSNAVVWAGLAWVSSASVGLEAECIDIRYGRPGGHCGVARPGRVVYSGVIGLAALWGVGVFALATWSAPAVAGMYPRAMARLSGASGMLHPTWALALAGVLGTFLGADIPERISAPLARRRAYRTSWTR